MTENRESGYNFVYEGGEIIMYNNNLFIKLIYLFIYLFTQRGAS